MIFRIAIFGSALLIAAVCSPSDATAKQSRMKLDRVCKQYEKYGDANGVYDAEPGKEPVVICAVPPGYPSGCVHFARRKESVKAIFDVTAAGRVTNIRVIETTHKCVTSAAIEAVEQWRYQRSTTGAVDIEKKILFLLTSDE